MKSLLTAVAIVAALCVVSIAAPPENDAQEKDGINNAPTIQELRVQYLRMIEERVGGMSEAELKAAIDEAKAEKHWNDAAANLSEAAKELAKIRQSYPRTRYARTANNVLGVLQSAGIDTGQALRGGDMGYGPLTAPPSQAPASRRQTR